MNNIPTIAIIIIIFVGIASPWLLKRWKSEAGPGHPVNATTNEEMLMPDQPISFGYKCMWFAIKSTDPAKLIATLNLTRVKPCNWQTGTDRIYGDYIFITPPIDRWTLACGYGLPHGDTPEGIQYVKELLKTLSYDYNEAQFFCTHRVTEYHCWIRAVDGNVTRVYSFLGEAGENVLIEGEPTPFEKMLNLVDTSSEEAKDERYLERKDLTLPTEDTLMKVAENWSVNPSTLEVRNDIEPGLGLLAEW